MMSALVKELCLFAAKQIPVAGYAVDVYQVYQNVSNPGARHAGLIGLRDDVIHHGLGVLAGG